MRKYQIDRIGILGGTFDPAHKGHLAISKIARKKINLKKIYWIVTKKNPFKNKPYFSLKIRLSKAKKIARNLKFIDVLFLENKIRSNRSIDVLKYLIKKDKPKNLYFIIGSDILLEFHKWKNWKKLVKLAKLIVFSREGYDKKVKESIVLKHLKKNNIIFIKNRTIKISSTMLRKMM
tara:strand:- start:1041 stop:1571 length:531 start_codon:yes stop_codon:yes gene_type:complete